MMHLSRLSEEIILWSSQEFHFIELDDTFLNRKQYYATKEKSRYGRANSWKNRASIWQS